MSMEFLVFDKRDSKIYKFEDIVWDSNKEHTIVIEGISVIASNFCQTESPHLLQKKIQEHGKQAIEKFEQDEPLKKERIDMPITEAGAREDAKMVLENMEDCDKPFTHAQLHRLCWADLGSVIRNCRATLGGNWDMQFKKFFVALNTETQLLAWENMEEVLKDIGVKRVKIKWFVVLTENNNLIILNEKGIGTHDRVVNCCSKKAFELISTLKEI